MKFSDLMRAPLANLYAMTNLELMLRNLNLDKDDVVLDIGCGSGFSSFIVSKYAREVIAVDISHPLIEFLNGHPKPENVKYLYVDATREPPNELLARFDKCLCIDVLEHVADPSALLKFSSKILRPEGLLVMTFPINKPEHGRNYLTPEIVQDLFECIDLRADIRIVEQGTFGSFVSGIYGKIQSILRPSKEADTFEDLVAFQMMIKPRKLYMLYRLGIISLFKVSRNSYRLNSSGTRALIIARKV